MVPELPLSRIVKRRPETVFSALFGMSSAWIPAEITKQRNRLKVARRITTVGWVGNFPLVDDRVFFFLSINTGHQCKRNDNYRYKRYFIKDISCANFDIYLLLFLMHR